MSCQESDFYSIAQAVTCVVAFKDNYTLIVMPESAGLLLCF